MRAAITSVGHYVPPDVLDNQFFESRLDTSDEWIRSRTGIVERRIARVGATSGLIVPAALRCLEARGIEAGEIDCILVATVTPDYVFPSTAAKVQAEIQAWQAWGFDISAACCGFIMALIVATRFVETGAARKVLVCGADKMTSITNYEDRLSAVLFGDAAGVALIEPSPDETVGIIDHVARMDGRHVTDLYMPAGGSAKPPSHETITNREHYLVQDGASVFKAANAGMVEITQELLNRNGLSPDDIQWLVPHQANRRIINAVGKRIGVDSKRVMCNIERYGNTSSATIPLCLSEWAAKGALHQGDNVVLASFGAGYTMAAAYLRWAIQSPMILQFPQTLLASVGADD
ncbi:MAG TPA: beta-ketoacyl-ACP synthase III [Candidatus Angelobacter sp.]|nr:beta-ketoacyl-ACP synthase III [Candidatus Angelobacter sp.]